MPKISIIVPIYNVEKYLRECLDSLINQTLKDIEIICVNDGSTDNSYLIIQEYKNKDSRIKVINKKNSGYGHSMNLGIENAISKYIGILESDDIAMPNMFEDLYNLIVKNDCDMVKSNYFLYYSKSNKLIKMDMIKTNQKLKITNALTDKNILEYNPSVWSGLYKKDFLLKNNIKFLETSGASYQDTSFYLKVAMMADRIILTEDAYIYYRQDNEKSSVNSKEKVYCLVKEFKELYNFMHKYPKLEYFNPYIYAIQFSRYHWNLNRISNKYTKEFFNYFYNEFKMYYECNYLSKESINLINKLYDFELFINSPQKYLAKFLVQKRKNKLKMYRRNIIQIRLNKQDKYIKLFGKVLIGE